MLSLTNTISPTSYSSRLQLTYRSVHWIRLRFWTSVISRFVRTLRRTVHELATTSHFSHHSHRSSDDFILRLVKDMQVSGSGEVPIIVLTNVKLSHPSYDADFQIYD